MERSRGGKETVCWGGGPSFTAVVRESLADLQISKRNVWDLGEADEVRSYRNCESPVAPLQSTEGSLTLGNREPLSILEQRSAMCGKVPLVNLWEVGYRKQAGGL